MARIVRDWRVDLVLSYPDLFHAPDGAPKGAAGWPSVDDGWRDLLQRACVRIRKAVQADGGTFRFTEIKSKYGALRLYWTGELSPAACDQVEDAVDLAEARSHSTCEICGDLGRLYGNGWLTTRCATHAEGRPAVEVGEGFENLHVEHRFVGGQTITRFRMYDRDRDGFVDVDVDPSSVGTREA